MFTDLEVTSKIECMRQVHLSSKDWHQEQLNFVPLRGSWFAQSEADFDLEEEIDKFFIGDKKVLLLLGDSGAGKSLYTQSLAIKLWKTHAESRPIPLWISLPSLKDPINHAIEETLASYGFTAEQIEQLRKTQRFVFILDAYDEIRQFKNLYVSNQLGQWQCKIIITCRREYLYRQDNYKLYFQPFQGEKAQHAAYDEIIIRPFNPNQIQAYIQQYVSNQETIWKEPERYEKAIEEIPGLRNLITTPFMLKLTMEVLPSIIEKHQSELIIERKRLTQAALYDVFVEQWFERQEQKLKSAKQIREDEDIKPEFWAYAKALAQAMHERNLTQVIYEEEDTDLYGEVTNESPWKRFFNPENSRTRLLQTACLIREVSSNHYAFIHASLLEYFLTRNLYENMLQQDSELQQRTPSTLAAMAAAVGSEYPIESSAIISQESITTTWHHDYFNQRVLVNEPGTLQFLSDRAEEQESFKDSLFERVYASRRNPEMRIAAGNAITILNQARISFSGKDLHGICIGGVDNVGKSWGANLSQAVLDSVDLSRADLSNVYLFQVYLNNADFTGACLKDINLGAWPNLQGKYACYSSDGSILVTAADTDLRIYSAREHQLLKEIKLSSSVIAISISNNGKLLAIAEGSHIVRPSIRIWDINNANFIQTQKIKGSCLAFSDDGDKLATGDLGGLVRIWDVKTGHCIRTFCSDDKEKVRSLAFSHDGKLLASGEGYLNLILWEVCSGRRLKILQAGGASSIVFNMNDKLLISADFNEEITIWDVETGSCIKNMKGHTGTINSICLNKANTQLLSASDDSTARVWDIESGCCIRLLEDSDKEINSIAFSHNECQLLFAGDDNVVRIWEANPGYCTEEVGGHLSDVKDVRFSHNNKLLASAGNEDDTVRLWDVKSGRCLNVLNGNSGYVNAVAFSYSDELLASVSQREVIHLWKVLTGCCINILKGHDSVVWSVAFSHDDKRLASGSWDNTIRIWIVESGACIKILRGHADSINSLAFSQNDLRLISGSADRTICLWEIDSETCIQILRGHSGAISSISYSNDYKLIVSGAFDGSVRVWKADTFQCIKVLKGHEREVTRVCFSCDDKRLISVGNDKTLRIWDQESEQCLMILKLNNAIDSMSHSPNGKLLCLGSSRTILLYELNDFHDQLTTMLLWRTSPVLSSEKMIVDNVIGLSEQNLALLKQRGNIKGTPLTQGILGASTKPIQTLFFTDPSKINRQLEDDDDASLQEAIKLSLGLG